MAGPRTRSVRTRGESRRDEILAVAAEQFARSGYVSTSLREIAEGAHILPGSLYHHFESKEAIAVELIEAMQPDLISLIARGLEPRSDPLVALNSFAHEVAAFSRDHRAAVKLCLYDAPSSATHRLREVVRSQPEGLERTWVALVKRAAGAGALRVPDVDVRLLALALHHCVLVAGDLVSDASPELVADTLTSLLVDGLWLVEPDHGDETAGRVAEILDAIRRRWSATPNARAEGRQQEILAAAREQFARRGFDATTMRDVANAAGMRAASLYRHFASKDALLATILNRFSGALLAATEEIVAGAETPGLGLDGLFGLMALAGVEFHSEYDIVKTWWRNLTPDEPDITLAENRRRFSLLRSVLAAGISDGTFRLYPDLELLAVCVRDLLWLPFQVALPPQKAHRFLRQTVGLGAGVP